MPSVSAKQNRTMRAAEHDPAFAKKIGIPQNVARDFVAADKAAGKFQAKKAPPMKPKMMRRAGRKG